MLKTGKKIVSVIMIVIMCLTMAPLQGFVGLDISSWFASEAEAAALLSDLCFFEEDYIASIILNTNTESCAVSDDGKSVASMTLDYYTQPQNISISKCFTDALEGDADFMSSVAAWEVLTFEPTDIYSEAMTKQGYYQTILFNILEVAVNYNIIPTIVKNMNNHVISTLKAINELEIKVDDIVVSGETSWDLLNADYQHQIIQKTAGHMTELEMRNQSLSDFAMLVKTCTTVTDFVEKAAQLTALTTLTEDVKAVIDELYANSSFVNNMELKTSILELKTAMNSKIDSVGTIGLEMLCSTGKLSMDVFLSQMWAETVTSLLGSLGAGLLIGQVIGRGLSNILFSTDKVIEQFYTMQALSDVEVLMCKTVKSLGQKYIASQNTTNVSNFLKAIDLLYNTYKLDFEYTADFAEIIYTKGLINKVNLFVSGTPDSLEKINSIVSSVNSSLNSSLGMITDIDNYCWYLETDFPEVFAVYYSGMSDEEIVNKYVDEVRQLTVACPTDVDVYDAEGNLVVCIKNNLVELCLPGYVCIVEQDVKYILLNADNQSAIHITGTADGTMNYTICEGDKTGFKRTMIFKDIILTEGCTYEAKLPEKTRLRSDEYSLTSNTGETIKPSYDTQPDIKDNIVDVIVAEELFDGFPIEVIDLVANTMFNMKSVVDLSSYDISTDDAVALFSAIAKYYPTEYSLIANSDFTYKIIVSPNLDRIMKIRFYYGDDANLSVYQKRVNDLNAEIDALVAKVKGMDEFEKALYIHDYIVLNSEYDLELLDYMEKNNFRLPGELRSEKYTEYSILVNGTGVCGSYALAYRAVLNAAGMECLYLSSAQMNHAWNMVKIDGYWYHVDCCWDDPVPDQYGRARRTYFLRTDEEIMELNHYSWTPGQYKASSDKYSEMPRNYDIKQKYDDGKWYYLEGSTLYSSNEYGENEIEITSISATSIDVENGYLYYSVGRNIYEYDLNTSIDNVVYILPKSKSGDILSFAKITNIYIEDENIEFYKTIYSDKRLVLLDKDVMQKEKYQAISDLEISQTKAAVDIFDTMQLTSNISGIDFDDDIGVTWASSNDSVVSVDQNGLIKAKNVGEATITVSCLDYVKSCDIEVIGDGLTGLCGNNVQWEYVPEKKELLVMGSGTIESYDDADTRPWIKFIDEIETIKVDSGVVIVGERAFYGCLALKEVYLDGSVEEVKEEAFKNCIALESVYFSEALNVIEAHSFYNCYKLKKIIIPVGTEKIETHAFFNCSNLEKMIIESKTCVFEEMLNVSPVIIYGYTDSTIAEYANLYSLKFVTLDAMEHVHSYEAVKVKETCSTYGYTEHKCSTCGDVFINGEIDSTGHIDENLDCTCDDCNLNLGIHMVPEKIDKYYIKYTVSITNSCSGFNEQFFRIYYTDEEGAESSIAIFPNADLWSEVGSKCLFEINIPGIPTRFEQYADVSWFRSFNYINGTLYFGIDQNNMKPILEDVCYEISTFSNESGKTDVHLLGHRHEYFEQSSSVEVTHLEDGYKEYVCSCGAKYVNEIKATGHAYQPISTIPGNCTTAPVYTYACSTCGDTYTKEGKIDDGHKYVETVIEPTCEEKGYTTATCSECCETVVYDFTSPIGHEFIINKSADYCSAHGTLNYSCKNCDYTEAVAADASELRTTTVTVEATCTKGGTVSEICDLCGATVSTEILSALSHDYSDEWTVDTEPTCTENGSKSKHCTRCDAKREVTVIEATGHNHPEAWTETTAATCEAEGLEYRVCGTCGEAEETRAIPKLGHNYSSEWTVDRAASCTENGSKSHHCTRCDAKADITVIAKSGHSMSAYVITKQSTCTDKGTERADCSKCDHYETRIIAAKGHNYGDNGICSNCGSDKTKDCSHLCHESGFMGFIWKIVQFFWKLFKMNLVCSCGAKHY